MRFFQLLDDLAKKGCQSRSTLNVLLPSRNLLEGSVLFTRRMKFADIGYDRAPCKRNSFSPFRGGIPQHDNRALNPQLNIQLAYLGNNYNAPNTNTSVLNFLLYYLGDDSTCVIHFLLLGGGYLSTTIEH